MIDVPQTSTVQIEGVLNSIAPRHGQLFHSNEPGYCTQTSELWEYVPDPAIVFPSDLYFFQDLIVSAEVRNILCFDKAVDISFNQIPHSYNFEN